MANTRGRTSGMMALGERLAPLTPTRVKIVPGSDWTEDHNGHYLLVDLEGFNKEKVKLEVNVTANHLTLTGERQVNEKEHVYIEESFPIPANSDVDKITGKFDGEILYVTVPKVVKAVQENKVPEIIENQKVEPAPAAEITHPIGPKNNDGKYRNIFDGKNDTEPNRLLGNARIFFSPEIIRKWEEDNGILQRAKEVLSKNKGMIIRKWEEDNGILQRAKEVLSKNKGMIITAIVAFSLGMLVSHKFEAGE